MKTYWSIPGPKVANGYPCIAFYKYDGSNLRFEWSRKLGWHRFGTRYRVVTSDHRHWGPAFPLFEQTLAEGFERVFHDDPVYQSVERATVYCEFFGASSFAGQHDWDEPKELIVIDVSIHKRGIVLPADFVAHFGHLRTAEVVYEGPFDWNFIEDVRTGIHADGEGVVAKGIKLGRNQNSQHGLWMSKVKTRWWLHELKLRAEGSDILRRTLSENLAEQRVLKGQIDGHRHHDGKSAGVRSDKSEVQDEYASFLDRFSD